MSALDEFYLVLNVWSFNQNELFNVSGFNNARFLDRASF